MAAATDQSEKVDEYIAGFPDDVRMILEKIRTTIKLIAPEARETIGYGIPTFKLNGKNLVHYAAYKSHIGFYPSPSAMAAFEKELGQYRTSRGAVQFPLDEPIPFDLIKKIVRYRVKENMD